MEVIDSLLVNYPFLPSARETLNDYPLDGDTVRMLHDAIMNQAQYRIDSAIKHAKNHSEMQRVRDFRYEPYNVRTKDYGPNPEVVEFYSYFAAVFAAKDESFLVNALARTEATRAKTLFVNERPEVMIAVLRQMVQLGLTLSKDGLEVTVPVVNYLRVSTRYGLTSKEDKWKLVNLPLEGGTVHLSMNTVRDLFASVVQGFMLAGMRSLRKSPVPESVRGLAEELRQKTPARPRSQGGQYQYIERLLQSKITDGRHRVIWLILVPYFVTVKGMDEGSATEAVLAYVGDTSYRRFVTYNVKRAVRNGLFPPSESSLRTKHPDVFNLLPKEIFQYETVKARQK